MINAENEIIYHPSGITQLPMTDMNKWNEFHNHAKKAVDGSDIFEYRKIIEEITFFDVCECLRNSFAEERFAISVIKNN